MRMLAGGSLGPRMIPKHPTAPTLPAPSPNLSSLAVHGPDAVPWAHGHVEHMLGDATAAAMAVVTSESFDWGPDALLPGDS